MKNFLEKCFVHSAMLPLYLKLIHPSIAAVFVNFVVFRSDWTFCHFVIIIVILLKFRILVNSIQLHGFFSQKLLSRFTQKKTYFSDDCMHWWRKSVPVWKSVPDLAHRRSTATLIILNAIFRFSNFIRQFRSANKFNQINNISWKIRWESIQIGNLFAANSSP